MAESYRPIVRRTGTRHPLGTYVPYLPYGAVPTPARPPARPGRKPQAPDRLGEREAKVLAALDSLGSALPRDLVVMEDEVRLLVTQLRRSLGILRQHGLVTMQRQGQRNLWTTVLPSE